MVYGADGSWTGIEEVAEVVASGFGKYHTLGGDSVYWGSGLD